MFGPVNPNALSDPSFLPSGARFASAEEEPSAKRQRVSPPFEQDAAKVDVIHAWYQKVKSHQIKILEIEHLLQKAEKRINRLKDSLSGLCDRTHLSEMQREQIKNELNNELNIFYLEGRKKKEELAEQKAELDLLEVEQYFLAIPPEPLILKRIAELRVDFFSKN